jgi:hypothetical protein
MMAKHSKSITQKHVAGDQISYPKQQAAGRRSGEVATESISSFAFLGGIATIAAAFHLKLKEAQFKAKIIFL